MGMGANLYGVISGPPLVLRVEVVSMLVLSCIGGKIFGNSFAGLWSGDFIANSYFARKQNYLMKSFSHEKLSSKKIVIL